MWLWIRNLFFLYKLEGVVFVFQEYDREFSKLLQDDFVIFVFQDYDREFSKLIQDDLEDVVNYQDHLQ